MISELLKKQLQREEKFIFDNVRDFIYEFFDDADGELEMIDDGEISYRFAFEADGMTTLKFWIDDDNNDIQEDYTLSYEDYNKWCEAVNTKNTKLTNSGGIDGGN